MSDKIAFVGSTSGGGGCPTLFRSEFVVDTEAAAKIPAARA